MVYRFGDKAGAVTRAKSEIVDLVKIEDLGAGPTDVQRIPFLFCSDFVSEAKGVLHQTQSRLSLGFFKDESESHHNDSVKVFGDSLISHTDTGKICRVGYIEMTGPHAYFSFKIKTETLGKSDFVIVTTAEGIPVRVDIRDGVSTATFNMSFLLSNAKCYSASGSFPGCERKILKKEKMCRASGGNPINFALGVKYQNETDYSGGMLSFSRLYCSDGEVFSGTIGTNWHHNFELKANIISTPESTTVDVIDADGIMTVFRQDDEGDWEAVDKNFTSTFESLFDESTLVGYLYTAENDTREYYNLNGLISRLEYQGGESLDFTHDDSDRLATVTDEKGIVNCQDFDLYAGVNIVGFQCLPLGYLASQLLNDIGDSFTVSSIQRFESASGRFQALAYQGGAVIGNDFPIKVGEAYLIHMYKDFPDFDPIN